jgi:hypothetical protein
MITLVLVSLVFLSGRRRMLRDTYGSLRAFAASQGKQIVGQPTKFVWQRRNLLHRATVGESRVRRTGLCSLSGCNEPVQKTKVSRFTNDPLQLRTQGARSARHQQ